MSSVRVANKNFLVLENSLMAKVMISFLRQNRDSPKNPKSTIYIDIFRCSDLYFSVTKSSISSIKFSIQNLKLVEENSNIWKIVDFLSCIKILLVG